MMKKIMFLLLAIAPVVHEAEAGLWDKLKNVFVNKDAPKPPTIKVLITHETDNVNMEVKGDYNIYDPYKNETLGAYFGGKAYPVKAISTGIRWGEEFPGVYQLQVMPDNQNVTTVVNGKEYKGIINVYDIGGAISIVNEIKIEDYIQSIMTATYSKDLPEEALAAAAIAARTQALYLASSSTNRYWNVDADEVNYHGVTRRPSDNLARALASTKYMVLSQTSAYEGVITPFPISIVTENGKPAKAQKKLILADAIAMAQKGENAARILQKAFPDAKIELVHAPEMPNTKQVADSRY